MSVSKGEDVRHVAESSVYVHGHDGTRARRKQALKQGRIHQIIVLVHIAGYGLQPGAQHGEEARRKRIGRDYDLIAVAPMINALVGHEYQRQRIQSVGHTHAMLHAAIVGKAALKSRDPLSVQICAALHHLVYYRREAGLIFLRDLAQAQILYHASNNFIASGKSSW